MAHEQCTHGHVPQQLEQAVSKKLSQDVQQTDVCLLLVPTTQSISMLQARMKHGNLQYQTAPRREWSGNSSSTDSELEPQEARCSWQLDLVHYPELEEEVQRKDGRLLPVRVQSAQNRCATENGDMAKSPNAHAK